MAGHVLSQGHTPRWAVVATTGIVAVPGAAVLSRRRLTDTQLLVALAAAQLAYHAVCSLPGACAAVTAQGASPGGLSWLVEHDTVAGPPPGMPLAGHLVTLLLSARLLGITEGLLWQRRLVEFLDFECEGCGAFYPVVEKLREEYGDRVTFVARCFPMPGHRNGELAARTAQAAARQGKFEEMYSKLFTTQQEWGEAQESKQDVLRVYAKQLGLAMAEFDTALADLEVAERVQDDQRDSLGLGVQGTPTFFVDGEMIRTPGSYEAFRNLIDARLAD
ncbi:DsbA family protein [Streptomyces sp. HD]|uniref:DsbA family protein n=1 Tax=Streptomyces sp. HD TaxID=3020892 RepID=UPI00232B81EE|nr:thioredoxin domain-containing protein [Streptomyces sp. HD]MDC0767171.1 thioredoxin domain-containing protein [Streptomyces sp. HD]